MRSPFLALVAVALLSLAACGDNSSTGGGQMDGAESPDALVAYLKAELDKPDADMSAMVPVTRPEDRGILAFTFGMMAPEMMIMMGGGMAEALGGMAEAMGGEAKGEKADPMKTFKEGYGAVLAKHGVESKPGEILGKMQAMESDPAAGKAELTKLFEGVDHVAFIRDVHAFMKKNSKKEGGKSMGPSKDDFSLDDVTIEVDGDKAVAKAPGEKDSLYMVKQGDRWYLDFMSMMKNR